MKIFKFEIAQILMTICFLFLLAGGNLLSAQKVSEEMPIGTAATKKKSDGVKTAGTVSEETTRSEMGIHIARTARNADLPYDQNLQKCLQNSLKDQYIISTEALIELVPFVNVKDEKLIEGMETITAVRVELGYLLKNKIQGTEISWTAEEMMGKGENKRRALQNATQKFCKDKEQKASLLEFINGYLNNKLKDNCSQVVEKVKALQAAKKYDEAFLTLNYVHGESSCADAKKSLEQELLAAQQKYACDKIIQETTIKAESGYPWQMHEAIAELLKIPPGSECAQDAIAIAKKIGENNKATKGKGKETLDQHILILNENRQSEWLSQHRRNLYRKSNVIHRRSD